MNKEHKKQSRDKGGRFGPKKTPKVTKKGKIAASKPKPKSQPKPKKVEKKDQKSSNGKKMFLVGDKVVKAANMNDTKGDGVLHLKKRETSISRTSKFLWED